MGNVYKQRGKHIFVLRILNENRRTPQLDLDLRLSVLLLLLLLDTLP